MQNVVGDDDAAYRIKVNVTSETAKIDKITFVNKENESIIGELDSITAGQQYSVKPYYVKDDYEDSDVSEWSLYGTGNISIVDDNDNKSVKFTYTSSSIGYYEYTRLFTPVYGGNMIYSADVKFSMGDEGIYLKARNTDVNKIMARLRNVGGILYYYNNSGKRTYLYYPDSTEWTRVTSDKWYTVQFAADLKNKVYDIYIIDKETGYLIGQITDLNFLDSDVNYINAFSVGSSNDMQIDNLKVYKPTLMGISIRGDSYAPNHTSSATSYTTKYSVRGLAQCNEEFINYSDLTNSATVTWSVSDTDGVTINSTDDTGNNSEIILSSTSEKKFILYATIDSSLYTSKVINAIIK